MKRTGVLYLIFFLTLSVVIASTFLMTHTHLDDKMKAEKNREINKVQMIQTSTVKIFKSKLDNKDIEIATSRIRLLLAETKLELYKISKSNSKSIDLNSLIRSIKKAQKKNALSGHKKYKRSLNSLLKKIAHFPKQIQVLRSKLSTLVVRIKYVSNKIRKLLIVAIAEDNLSSLSRQHTLMIGRMLVQVQKIRLTLKDIITDAKFFTFSDRHILKLHSAIQVLNYYNQSLLTGNPKDKIVELKTSKVKGLLLSIKVHMSRMQSTSSATKSSYKLLSNQSKELKNLLASIDKQKEIH